MNREFVLPRGQQIASGFAIGFVFVPLTVLATGTLRNEQIGNATGIYNLMRNVGGSFGIAAVTTMLARGAQTHQAAMISHLTPYRPRRRCSDALRAAD